MKILALDSSAKTASAAITDSEQLISEAFVNAGLTHSETLLPMVDSVLSLARLTMADIDGCVITDGPGSFTGIRIGIAAVKGLAMPNETKCCGVSTLKAMAYNLRYDNCIACCAMDARCSQVYSAIFRCFDGKVERLTEDDAIPASKLPEIQAFSACIRSRLRRRVREYGLHSSGSTFARISETFAGGARTQPEKVS